MGIQESRLVFEAAFLYLWLIYLLFFFFFSLHKPQGMRLFPVLQAPRLQSAHCLRFRVLCSHQALLPGEAKPLLKLPHQALRFPPRTAAVTVGVGVSAGVGLPGAGSSGAGISGGVGGLFLVSCRPKVKP